MVTTMKTIFSDHNAIKLEINNKGMTLKISCIFKKIIDLNGN